MGCLPIYKKLSGFSWDHDTNSVVVDSKDVWEEYVKFHPKLVDEWEAFPMFQSWQLLFGKDRANRWRFVFGGTDFMDLSAGGSQNASPSTSTSNANATTPPTNGNVSTASRPLKKARKLTRAETKQDSLTEAFGSYMSRQRGHGKARECVAYEHRLSERDKGKRYKARHLLCVAL
ncbi:hypothetical protein Acr_08g0018390 [Actinidia rufa]|uniref:Myb/SANT-like domain-containing protein n=1 Tax=Actinidia rufa TaxID=165716 RepID=A0A7J0F4A5_9ERIC|nr:hypothetical protein Acr_08g0018390 [Actinidia rufa]